MLNVRIFSIFTSQDFQQSGIFKAQVELETSQREEEDRLYRQIQEERKKKVSSS